MVPASMWLHSWPGFKPLRPANSEDTMIYTLILLSFLSSVAVSFVLRQIDRHEIRRIRRQSEEQHLQLEKAAEERIRAIDDATIDFEMKVRQARSAREEMTALLEENRQQIEILKEDSRIIARVQAEIRRISEEASEVNQQVHLLEAGLERIGRTRAIIESLEKRTGELSENLHLRGEEVRERLEEILNQIIAEARDKTREFVEKENQFLRDLHTRQETISRSLDEEMHQVDTVHERIAGLQDQLEEKLTLENVRIEERFHDLERRFQERIHAMESGLSQVRETAVKSMKEEIARIRSELDSFNLETIASRDEIINDTRRMATGLVDQIEAFQAKFLNAENRLLKLIEDGKSALNEKFEELLNNYEMTFKARTEEMHGSLEKINEEIAALRREKSAQIEARLQSDYENLIAGIAAAGERLRDSLSSHVERLRNEIQSKMNADHEDLLKTRESFIRIKEELEDRIDSLEDQIREVSRARQKIEEFSEKARSELIQKQADLIEELERRASKFMEEQDQKLGRLNTTIDEKISRQLTMLVDRGQIQVEELERRTADTIRRSIEHMERDLSKARDEFAGIRAEVINETQKARDLRDSIIKEIHEDQVRMRRFEEKLSLVDTAETLALRLDEAVSALSARLNEARAERSEMDAFISKLENLKEIRQKLEKEVRYLTERSILLDGAEERFAALTGQIQELEARFATVSGADRVLERIEERMLKFEEYRKSFEAFFRDLADRRKYFETTLNTIEKSRREAAESAMMAKNIADQLERIDMRRDAARKEIEELEKRVASLQHMDREFQKVEARFEQMETLLTDLEQKQDQIATMSKKIGEIAKQSDFMRGELESLLSEAGEKMDRLSAFYETVDQMLQEAERAAAESRAETKPSTDRRKAGSLEEWKKEGILSLYVNHKWEPELIAERMKIDVATVRSVIGTYKQSHPV